MGERKVTRNLVRVQNALDALTPAEKNINEMVYYKKYLNTSNHSISLCSSVKQLIEKVDQQHAALVSALVTYGESYCAKDSNLAAGNNSDYVGECACYEYTYISAPEHEKSYWEKTWNQIVLGDFSEDVTLAGTLANVAMAFFGVDIAMDIRDTAANIQKKDWFWAGVSAVSLLPIVGLVGKGAKGITKGVTKGAKAADAAKQGGNLYDGVSSTIKKGNEVLSDSKGAVSDVVKGSSKSIPNVGNATINPKKITEYALNPNHPVGGNKAKVFESALAYNQSNADDLIQQIYAKLPNSEATLGKLDEYGQRYTVDMLITGPNGNTATVRTGWIIKKGSDIPELTTLWVND